MKKPVFYAPDIDASTLTKRYDAFPFNLRTMRARRQVDKSEGCGYVDSIARILAAQDGVTIARGESDGTPYAYLAYAANKAHDVFLDRARHHRLVREGWKVATQNETLGLRVECLVAGMIVAGKVVRGPNGPGFQKPKVRRSYYPFGSGQRLYIRHALTAQPAKKPRPVISEQPDLFATA